MMESFKFVTELAGVSAAWLAHSQTLNLVLRDLADLMDPPGEWADCCTLVKRVNVHEHHFHVVELEDWLKSEGETHLGQQIKDGFYALLKEISEDKNQNFSQCSKGLQGHVGDDVQKFISGASKFVEFSCFPVTDQQALDKSLTEAKEVDGNVQSADSELVTGLTGKLDGLGDTRAKELLHYMHAVCQAQSVSSEFALEWEKSISREDKAMKKESVNKIGKLRKLLFEISEFENRDEGHYLAELFARSAKSGVPWSSNMAGSSTIATWKGCVEQMRAMHKAVAGHWVRDLSDLKKQLSNTLPAWEHHEENLLDDDKLDIRTELVRNPHYKTIAPLAARLKEMLDLIATLNADGSRHIFSPDNIKDANGVQQLGTRTVVITYLLFCIHKVLPNLQGKELKDKLDELLTQSRNKGVTLPTQIRNHLQELKERALGTSSSKSQKDASTEKPDKGQAKGKVGTSNV